MITIKKVFIIFILAFSACTSFRAQHCGYCYASIQVFRIHAESDSQSIEDLVVYLKDTNGNVIQNSYYSSRGNDYVYDTVFIYQNPKRSSQGLIDNANPIRANKIHFWFAEDNYVFLPNSGSYGAITLVIEDRDGKKNGGKFKTTEYNFEDAKFFPLCTGRSDWDRSKEYRSFFKDYEPVTVVLKPL